MILDQIRRLFGGDRRRSDRDVRSQLGHLFAGVRPLGPVLLLDMSSTGARVERTEDFDPEGVTRLLIIKTSQLIDVEHVRTEGAQLGFRLGKSRHIRGFTDGELDQIKAWWTSHRMEAAD